MKRATVLLAVFCILFIGATPVEIVRTFDVASQNDTLVPQSIDQDGHTFDLTSVIYEVMERKPIAETKTFTITRTEDGDYKADMPSLFLEVVPVNEDGYKGVLPQTELKVEQYSEVADRSTSLAKTLQNGRQYIDPAEWIGTDIDAAYYDELTDTHIPASLKLANTKQLAGYTWERDLSMDFLHELDAKLRYRVGDEVLDSTLDKPNYAENEKTILSMLFLDAKYNRIVGSQWAGESTVINGCTYRKALYTVETYKAPYETTYKATIALPDVMRQKATATYSAKLEKVVDHVVTYRATATYRYTPVVPMAPIITASAAVAVAILFAMLWRYLVHFFFVVERNGKIHRQLAGLKRTVRHKKREEEEAIRKVILDVGSVLRRADGRSVEVELHRTLMRRYEGCALELYHKGKLVHVEQLPKLEKPAHYRFLLYVMGE